MKGLNESLIIMRKELKGYFNSPIAYIVITVFLAFTGFFFFKDFFYYNQAEMRGLFQTLPLMLSFVVPAVTMKLFAEERQTGSFEILMTLPVSAWDAVLGKFFAGTVFAAVMLSPTLIYLVTVFLVGSPDPGPVIGGYIGAVFLAAAYTSIGLLTSSFTRNQIVSFIISWAACFLLWILDKVIIFLPAKLGFLSYLGSDFHFQNIARGIIDSRDLIYFASVCAISLMFTVKTIEERR
ncbi:MAG TPA: ABC transporter permease subunit [Spirochaetota bacterium]|nr:ABC transporter permease subunit [Spirochaetota bacterium]HPJ33842.1 ABC transporter permease subunit [Spirochaetota bacterium]